ncbi:MAG: hypothetical protein ACOX8R_10530 [Bacillota bacterium]|jgi:hypothetical protein
MMKYDQENEMIRNVDLFISLMVCFPEVGKIRYDRDRDLLRISFLLHTVDGPAVFHEKIETIGKAVGAYHRLKNTKNYLYDLNCRDVRGYRVMEVCRDLATASRSELAFIVDLFRQHFDGMLLAERTDSLYEDDYHWYFEEGRQPSLNEGQFQVDTEHFGNEILVYRDAGKVLVFSNG